MQAPQANPAPRHVHPSKVFISYAREDAVSARRLADDLTCMGVEPWLDQEQLLPGQAWESAIQTALEESDFVIVLLSQRQVGKRGYVQREIRRAVELLDEMPENQPFLIPARLDDCQSSHRRLSDVQWLDLFPSWEEGIRRLHQVFSRVPERTNVSPILDITGTQWNAVETPGGDWRFEFAPHGVFRYEDAAIDMYLENGRWRQEGNNIYVQLNDSYVQLQGELVSSRLAKGRGNTIAGRHFEWEALRRDTPHKWQSEPG